MICDVIDDFCEMTMKCLMVCLCFSSFAFPSPTPLSPQNILGRFTEMQARVNIHTLFPPIHLSPVRSLARMHELLVKCTHTYERINSFTEFYGKQAGSVFTVLRVHFISDVYGHLLLAPDHPRQRIQTSILLCTRARKREKRKKSSVTQAANLENQLPVPTRLSFHPLPSPLPKKRR